MTDPDPRPVRPGPSRPFSLAPLVFQTFACTMAMMSFTALAGPFGRTVGLEPWQMGLAVTVGGVTWMITAPVWGRASDRLGRRPVLRGGLAGFAVSFGLLCLFAALALDGGIAVTMVFVGLVVGRALAGAFFAAVPAAGTALIADHVPPDRRAGAMASVGMASGASIVAGPALVALLAPSGLALPLAVAALLPAVAVAVVWRALPPACPHRSGGAGRPLLLTDPRLRRPAIVAFVCMASVTAAQIVVGFFAIDRLGLSAQDGARVAGLALTGVGVALMLGQMAVRALGWSPDRLIRVGVALAALGFGAVAFTVTAPMLYAGYFVAAAGLGLVWPSLSALAANAVEAHEQGAAAGLVAAAQGLGTIVGPMVGTVLYGIEPAAPYALVAALLLTVSVGCRKKNAVGRENI